MPASHLHLQLSNVVHRPGLVIIVVVGHRGEAPGSLLHRHAAVRQVLHRTGAPNAVLWNPNGNTGRFKVLTLKNLHVDQVGRLWGAQRSTKVT